MATSVYVNLKTGEQLSTEQAQAARIAAAQAANAQWAAERVARMQACPCAQHTHS